MSISINKGSTTWSATIYFPRPGQKPKKKCITLGVSVEGQRPPSLRMVGDAAFERSRVAAQVAHDKLVSEIRSPIDAIAAADRAVELATNKKSTAVSIYNLETIWLGRERENGMNPTRETIANYRTYFAHFTNYMETFHKGVTDIRLVDTVIAAAWAKRLQEEGRRFNTFNRYLAALSAAFRAAAVVGNLESNPFSLIKRSRNKEAVAHRKPWTEAELDAIMKATLSDTLVGPIVVVAACTAMRRRDCILLKWNSVDLKAGYIIVRANKTGELCQIPIFPRLRAILEARQRNGGYVFPEAAAIFLAEKDNRNHFLLRLKKILAVAGIDYDKRNDFHSRFSRRKKASLSGWHSFKPTFVTLALNAAMPEALLRKVVGNQVVDIVLENYYQPAKEHLSRMMTNALPSVITGEVNKVESVRQLVERLNASNVDEIRALLLKAVQG